MIGDNEDKNKRLDDYQRHEIMLFYFNGFNSSVNWEKNLGLLGKDIITLSGSMFMLIQPEVIYLSSGNYEEFMKFNSQYLIQWELIKYGIKNKFKKHNFYGIPENINTHPKDYGIYEFKRGFNGQVIEMIGEFTYKVSITYPIYNMFRHIKIGIRNITKR